MSPSDDRDPRRWREAGADQPAVEAEIGVAIRGLRPSGPLDDVRVAHLRQEILRRASGQASHGRARKAFSLRQPSWVLACALVLLSSVTTAIAGMAFIRHERHSASMGPGARRDAAARRKDPRRWRVTVASPAIVDVTVADDEVEIAMVEGHGNLSGPAVATSVRLAGGQTWREATGTALSSQPPATVEPGPGPDVLPPPAARTETALALRAPPTTPRRARPSSAATAAPALSPLQPPPWPEPAVAHTDGEAATLADVLRDLRAGGDPRAALKKLDDRERRFPGGTLRREAALARVRALLRLGQQASALSVLDGMALDERAGDRSVMVSRGELRAAAGRCGDAVGDFSRVVASGEDELGARSLYGRGACRLATGDAAGARADFEAYGGRFPGGAQRAAVERALAGLLR